MADPQYTESVALCNVVQLYMDSAGIDYNANPNGTPDFFVDTITFAFDIAPVWAISGMDLSGSIDEYPDNPNDSNPDWGFEYGQQMTLCSEADVCSTASQALTNGPLSLPSISLNTHTGAGTGLYEYSYCAVDGAQARWRCGIRHKRWPS